MEEFFGNEINVDKEKVQITGINEIIKTDNNKPIIATHDIKSCIAVLIICDNEAYMTHIETLDKNKYRTGLEKIKTMCQNVDSPIKNRLVFYGEYKQDNQCNEVCEILNTKNIYPAYLDNHNGSIAYDFSINQFYGMDEDGIFYEYRLGAINKKFDPLVAYLNHEHTR